MKRNLIARLVLAALILTGTTDAQAANKICSALEQKIQQTPGTLEGRALNEVLFEAAALDCVDIATGLLGQGASISARNRHGATAFSIAAGKGSRGVVEMLLIAGADLHHTDLSGASPILRASIEGRRRVVGILLNAGADPNGGDNQGVTPMIAAAFNGDLRLLQTLLEVGVTIDVQDQTGKVALSYAAGRAFFDIVEALIQNGADADGVWGNGLTPLMWAAGHANDAPFSDGIQTAILLLDAGGDPERQDNRGRTPLMIAAERGHIEMVKFLLEYGVDRTVSDLNGDTAASLSATEEIRQLFNF